jgi:predicted transposase/invertase (TIGR01784 family)
MQVKEGDTYDTLKKCITINILDYKFLPMNKAHTVYHLTEDETKYRLTDILEVHFCELEKLRRDVEINDSDDPALNWMKFLAARTKGEMEMIAKDDKEIKEAYDYLQVISKDEENRMVYEARQAWLMDQRTREKVAREREEAMREREKAAHEREKAAHEREKAAREREKAAREEGIQNEKIKIAKNLLSIGMSIVDIVKVTGLKAGEIENLR